MIFKLEIMQVRKFLTSRSMTKIQDFGTHVQPAMRGSTFTLKPSRFENRNAGKISFFFLSPLSLSLSLSGSSLSLLFALPSLFFFLFFSFHSSLSTHTSFSSLFHPYLFSFLFIFSFLIFSSLPFSLFSSF